MTTSAARIRPRASALDREPRKRTRSPSPSSSLKALQASPVGTVADDREMGLGHRRQRLEGEPEILLRRQPAREHQRRTRFEVGRLDIVHVGRRVRQQRDVLGVGTPGDRELDHVRARTDDMGRMPNADVSHRTQAGSADAVAGQPDSSAGDDARAARALEGGVGGQLEDHRCPRGRGAGDRACEHPGRVDDVGAPRTQRDPSCDLGVPDAARQRPWDERDRVAGGRRACVGGHDRLDGVTASTSQAASSGA